MSTSNATDARAYQIGDAVTVPDDFCPGCMARTGPMGGLVVGYVNDGEQSNLFGDTPGPFYTVSVDHEHNSNGSLVYAESELAPATDHDWVAALERHETQLGCVTCGCTEPDSGWQGRVSSPREGWLCGPCNLLRAVS
jgi:hypothetical protein